MPIFFWGLQAPRSPVGQVQLFLSLDVWVAYKWCKFAPSLPLNLNPWLTIDWARLKPISVFQGSNWLLAQRPRKSSEEIRSSWNSTRFRQKPSPSATSRAQHSAISRTWSKFREPRSCVTTSPSYRKLSVPDIPTWFRLKSSHSLPERFVGFHRESHILSFIHSFIHWNTFD